MRGPRNAITPVMTHRAQELRRVFWLDLNSPNEVVVVARRSVADAARLDTIMDRIDRYRHVIGAESRVCSATGSVGSGALHLRTLGEETARCG